MKVFSVLMLCLFCFSGHANAVFDASTQYPSAVALNPLLASQPPSQPLSKATPPAPAPSAVRRPSQFEQYVSPAVNITDTQLGIINRLQRVAFRYSRENIPIEQIAVPVRIVKNSRIIDAGYLVGTPEAMASTFGFLGISNPFWASTNIKEFGYDIFNQTPSSFAPVENVPVGPDYLLGPGDELRIRLWGKINNEFNAIIDRDGSVNIPLLGVRYISGLTFKEAKDFLTEEFSRYYIPSQVKIDISMGKLRSIRVFVLGDVQQPGSYTISSLSTLINALFAAGGPTKEGTLRDIRLNRDGKTVAHFDMYDFLLNGDMSNDVRLMPQDVIFVPPVGPMAGIAGSVKTPAIYEMKGKTKVSDLINEAGGLNSIAYDYRLQLLRIGQHMYKTEVEMNLSDIQKNPDKNFTLNDGDLLTIFPVPRAVENTVRVSGAVKSPGMFGLKPGMKIGDLITYAGGLLHYADTENAELTRVNITPAGPKIRRIKINLQKAEEGDPKSNIELKGDDYLLVRDIPQWERPRVVAVRGEVLYPGDYIVKKGETLSSLIGRAGGFTDKAYLKGAEFTRVSVQESQQKALNDMINRLEQELLTSSAQQIQTSVTRASAVAEKVAAKQREALIQRLKKLRAKGRIAIKLAPLKKFKDSPYDIALESGDTLTVPDKPGQVQVIGSVYNQNAFVYLPDASVRRYIKKAAGATKNADEGSMYILKADGTAISRRNSGGGVFSIHYDTESHRWTNGGFMSRRLEPGDIVVVPVETRKTPWLREVKDITQVLFQVAMSTGVVLALH
ncbi:MAG: SLBB domain-containing protein [Nitrospirota bacterium]